MPNTAYQQSGTYINGLPAEVYQFVIQQARKARQQEKELCGSSSR